MHQIDTNSIRGTLITFIASYFSFQNITPVLQFVSLCVALAAGGTTLYLNLKKIKKDGL
jgi:hypothetical protein